MRDGGHLYLLAAPFGSSQDHHRRLRAIIGHATSVWNWRCLCVDQGLSDTEAVGAMAGMALAITPATQAEPAS